MGCLICYPLIYSISPQVSSVGDLQLADFKQLLANKSLQVEFAEGALQCGEYITVCKTGDSNQKGSTGSQQICDRGPVVRGPVQDPGAPLFAILLDVEVADEQTSGDCLADVN